MAFECLIFDLNNTLYARGKDMVEAFHKNVEAFLVEKCGMNEEKASNIMRNELHTIHGAAATFRRLRALGHDIDEEEYYDFVQGRLPYEIIKPDPELQALLQSIKQKKIVFTNSRRQHALKIIESLGFQECVDDFISFETLNKHLLNLPKSSLTDELRVVQKPSVESIEIARDFVKVDPHRVLYIDDDEDNFLSAKSVGFRTVLVKKKVSKEGDYVVENLVDLKEVIPELWL